MIMIMIGWHPWNGCGFDGGMREGVVLTGAWAVTRMRLCMHAPLPMPMLLRLFSYGWWCAVVCRRCRAS